MKLSFEWDEEKAKTNLKKHRVGFDEAITAFMESDSLTIHDPDHSADEQRYIDIGTSDKGRVLVVVYTERASNLALIVHHTDAEREWAYDRTSPIGKLDKAWDEAQAKGWTVVNMKEDWNTIFPFTNK